MTQPKPSPRLISLATLAAGLPVLAACWSSSQPGTAPQRGDVTVELAAVHLADDCGDAADQPPPLATAVAPAQSRSSAPRPSADIAQGSCAPDSDCSGAWSRTCEQTTMQLAVRSKAATPTTIRVKLVELLDDHGAVIGRLAPREPVVWGTDAYQPWDQTVAPGATLATSYALSAPPWDDLPGGQLGAASKTFKLRVTLQVGDADRTVDRTATVDAPAMIAPPVVT